MSIPASVVFGPARKRFTIGGVLLMASVGMCLLCMGAILFPAFQSANAAARSAKGMYYMKKLSTATLMYSVVYDDHFPPAMASGSAVRPYASNYIELNAGADRGSDVPRYFESVNASGGQILGDKRLSGESRDRVASPESTVMFHDEKPWSGRGLAGYVDSHVKFLPYAAMTKELLASPIAPPQEQTAPPN